MKLPFLFGGYIILQSNIGFAASWTHIPAGKLIMGSSKQYIEQGYGYNGVRKVGWFDQEDMLSSSFTFKNPNKKGECGCGKSFSA